MCENTIHSSASEESDLLQVAVINYVNEWLSSRWFLVSYISPVWNCNIGV